MNDQQQALFYNMLAAHKKLCVIEHTGGTYDEVRKLQRLHNETVTKFDASLKACPPPPLPPEPNTLQDAVLRGQQAEWDETRDTVNRGLEIAAQKICQPGEVSTLDRNHIALALGMARGFIARGPRP